MILTDLFSMILRLAELAFAAIVAGLTGEHLHDTQNVSAWDNGRHIYTIVVAAISILLAIVWLFPFSGSFIHWPTDFIISLMWFAAFGLLVDVSFVVAALFASCRLPPIHKKPIHISQYMMRVKTRKD